MVEIEHLLVMQHFRVVYFRRVCIPSEKWDIPQLYHEKGLHSFFIPCHRKYSSQIRKLGVMQLNCRTDRWEGLVEY